METQKTPTPPTVPPSRGCKSFIKPFTMGMGWAVLGAIYAQGGAGPGA